MSNHDIKNAMQKDLPKRKVLGHIHIENMMRENDFALINRKGTNLI